MTVVGPLDGNSEVAGPNTTAVNVSAAAGTFTAADVLTFDVVVFIHDAAGVVQSLQVFPAVLGGAVSSGAGGILASTPINFSVAPLGANLATAINTARSFAANGIVVSGGGPASGFGIGIVINDATVDAADGAETLLNLTNEATDTIINADDAGPLLTQVFRDSTAGAQKMIFVFDDDVDSNSTFANLANVDFESSTTSGGTFAALVAGAFAGNPSAIASSNQRAMVFPIVSGQENLAPAVGQFVRIVLAGTPGMNLDLKDLALNPTDAQPAIPVVGVTAPTISGAKWTTTISAAGTGTLRVDFSANVNSAALGNLAFWQNVVGATHSIVPSTAFGAGNDLTVTAVNAFDPASPSSVFLTVTSGGAATLAADGKDDSAGGANARSFNLAVDAAVGVPPQDFLGTALAGTSSVAVGDDIAPAVSGNAFTLDLDGDGRVDAFGWNFTEPITVTGASSTGFTLSKLATTVHPFDLFKKNLPTTLDPTAAINQDMTVLDTTAPIDNTFAPGTFTRQSQDTTGANRLQQNNVIVINFDPAAVDWDEDGTVGALDIDQEATPGTFDTNFANVAIDAAKSGLTDGNAVAMKVNAAAGALGDGAAAVACRVDFVTGDNVAGGLQKPSEQDAVVGDSATNNTASVIFNETVANGGISEPAFRFGTSVTERFAAGDFTVISGANSNIVSLVDNGGGGFGAGDTFTIVSTNNLNDGAGNAFPGNGGAGAPALVVQDGSAPYVVLIQDINGNAIHSAFLGGVDTAGFATTVTLTFSRDLKAGTGTTVTDWNIEGVGTPPSAPVLNGKTLTFTFPTNLVSAANIINVTYNGATALAANLITANGGTMAPVAAMNDTFQARLPQANVDGEFMAVMDIGGTITDTDGVTVAPDGTKVFGFISVPRINEVSFTMGGVEMTINSTASMQAFTNFFLGFSTHLYLIFDGQRMGFENDKETLLPGSSATEGIIDISLGAVGFGATGLTFTGSGSTVGSAVSSGALSNISGGKAIVVWDVLRSSDGTAFSLFNNGFVIGGRPIASTAIVTDGAGTYQLHMTAPISAFNSMLNAIGWPVIIVIEHTNGNRYPVSGMLNAVDLNGPLTFQGLNRQGTPFNSDANLAFSPNLSRVASRSMYRGWNGLADDRDSAWQSAANGILLPGGVFNNATGTPLNDLNALDQFVYFIDTNADGNWTSADDGGTRFGGIRVSTGSLTNCVMFTMTDKGVKTGNDIKAFSGGYAAGFFNGNTNNIGVFQFGPAMIANASIANLLFFASSPFINNLTNLGWAFMTVPNTTTSLANFLTDNAFDFFILFNRTANNAVDIASFSSAGGGDASALNRGDTLFVHKP